MDSSLHNVEGITLEWRVKDTPYSVWKKIEQNVIVKNVSLVLSFLPSRKNQILVDALGKSIVPIIGLQSLREEVYSKHQEGAMFVSMLPTEDLHARVLTDLILEFEESRFACIATESSLEDSFFWHLSQYISSDGSRGKSPRCLVLNSGISVEEFSAHLEDIHAGGIHLIVVHCKSNESDEMLSMVRMLNFKIYKRDFVWVFTDKAVGAEAKDFPEGSIGILKTQETGKNGMLKLYKGFLKDSVRLFAKSLKNSLKGLSHRSKLKCLEGEHFNAFKRRLYRNIINQSFLGETGPVQFCSHGERTAFQFTIVKATRAPEGGLHWCVMGHNYPQWTQVSSPLIFEPFLPKDLPRPRHLRIVSIDHAPFTVVHGVDYSSRLGTSCPSGTVPCEKYILRDKDPLSGNEDKMRTSKIDSKITHCCYGAMIDILIKLKEIEEFTFDLYLVADGKYGSVDPETNQMNGMIGDVSRGSADLALGFITITEGRSTYVDFTTPYMGTGLIFLVKKTKSKNKSFAESISDMRLISSFSTDLWFSCLAAFFTVVMSVWLIEKSYYYRNHKSSHLLPFEFIMYVYGNIFQVPLTKVQAKSFSVSFVMLVVNFAGLILVSSYTANLLASLITVDEVNVVSGIGDPKLVDPPEGFTFGALKDTSTEDFFRKSQNPRLRKIYQNMKKYNVDYHSDGVKKVISGELTAFISESRAGYYDSKCTLKEDGIGFELAGLAFALQKNSSWTASISRAIHKLKAQDTITEIFNKWTTSRCKTSQQSAFAHRMGLDEFEGFLFNTAMITFGCFLILLLEVFFYRRITRARRSFSPEQNGTALNAAKLPRVSTTND
ncbi:glutamate receptor ionotropic, NMDA 2A-like [Montipora capricornis]|uniref:glutamate receptor ionotropic, NMDA 2A-like n=1 Tax=Montipora capricornis TaxID=246305 RepID=UPI0035F10C34